MTTQVVTNWKKEWFEIEDATYLNTAAHTVMPRVSIRAVEHALEAKKSHIGWTNPCGLRHQCESESLFRK